MDILTSLNGKDVKEQTLDRLLDRLAHPKSKAKEHFIGGVLKNGDFHRRILTIRFSHAKKDMFYDLKTVFQDCKFALFTDKDHTTDCPSLILVVVLDRFVEPWEYEIVARSVASRVNLDACDDGDLKHDLWFDFPKKDQLGYQFYKNNWESPKVRIWNVDSIFNQLSFKNYIDGDLMSNAGERRLKRECVELNASNEGKSPEMIAFNNTFSMVDSLKFFLPHIFTPSDDKFTPSTREFNFAGSKLLASEVLCNGTHLYSRAPENPLHHRLISSYDLVCFFLFGSEKDSQEKFNKVLATQAEMFKGAENNPNTYYEDEIKMYDPEYLNIMETLRCQTGLYGNAVKGWFSGGRGEWEHHQAGAKMIANYAIALEKFQPKDEMAFTP